MLSTDSAAATASVKSGAFFISQISLCLPVSLQVGWHCQDISTYLCTALQMEHSQMQINETSTDAWMDLAKPQLSLNVSHADGRHQSLVTQVSSLCTYLKGAS